MTQDRQRQVGSVRKLHINLCASHFSSLGGTFLCSSVTDLSQAEFEKQEQGMVRYIYNIISLLLIESAKQMLLLLLKGVAHFRTY